ncbi:hypothetical protein K466DRAFT_151814 [Polyporus arcularius HHB13444]|uniref:Uncharacterized protein n=1 Tax=Polyporus arcularius HHB13444 TaxID=1314778 RepID=A0A5C3PAY9_9APHY|nr:hypothetical protein K466DRAFT_151814 [Polyporus arcularius HHB13444]
MTRSVLLGRSVVNRGLAASGPIDQFQRRPTPGLHPLVRRQRVRPEPSPLARSATCVRFPAVAEDGEPHRARDPYATAVNADVDGVSWTDPSEKFNRMDPQGKYWSTPDIAFSEQRPAHLCYIHCTVVLPTPTDSDVSSVSPTTMPPSSASATAPPSSSSTATSTSTSPSAFQTTRNNVAGSSWFNDLLAGAGIISMPLKLLVHGVL